MYCFTISSNVKDNGIVLTDKEGWYVVRVGETQSDITDILVSTEVNIDSYSALNPDKEYVDQPAIRNIAVAVPKDAYASSYEPVIMQTLSRDFDKALVYLKIHGIYEYLTSNVEELVKVSGPRTNEYYEVLFVLMRDSRITINDGTINHVLTWSGATDIYYVTNVCTGLDDPAYTVEQNMNRFNILT